MPYYAPSAYFLGVGNGHLTSMLPAPPTPLTQQPDEFEGRSPWTPTYNQRQIDQAVLQQQQEQKEIRIAQQWEEIAQQLALERQQRAAAEAAEQARIEQLYAQQAYQHQQQLECTPSYKASEYAPVGGVYSTGAGLAVRPSLAARRGRAVPSISNAAVTTAIEHPFFHTEQRWLAEQSPAYVAQQQQQQEAVAAQQQLAQEAAEQAEITPSFSKRGGSEYTLTGLRGRGAKGLPSLGAPSPSPAAFISSDADGPTVFFTKRPQAAESAYIGIPNDLVHAQSNTQRAFYFEPKTPKYTSVFSDENVRSALGSCSPAPRKQLQEEQSSFQGRPVVGNAFRIPTNALAAGSEYHESGLRGLTSCIEKRF